MEAPSDLSSVRKGMLSFALKLLKLIITFAWPTHARNNQNKPGHVTDPRILTRNVP